MVYDKENRLLTKTNADLTISSFTYAAEGLRRSWQQPVLSVIGEPVHTIVWDGSDYLGEY